ncbi:hypothetical protein BWI17_17995 [Betaproteobacteria bacterium GR16-43]|nr:hypothetical protein BWI17_17995 [Betaproteobacteria bacterium GR16-43]
MQPASAPQPAAKAPARSEPAAQAVDKSLQFEIDAESGKPVVRIVDPASGEVVRQMPTEEALEIARSLGRLEGLMIRVKA